jgi:hypothetical protein
MVEVDTTREITRGTSSPSPIIRTSAASCEHVQNRLWQVDEWPLCGHIRVAVHHNFVDYLLHL